MASIPSTPISSLGHRRNSSESNKLRISCNNCSASKIKCSKEKPQCFRCLRKGIACQYNIIKRSGRKQRNRPMSDPSHFQTASADSMGLVADLETSAPPDDVVQLSPRPPTTEYTDIPSIDSTTMLDPLTPSNLLLTAGNWGFEDFLSPQNSLPLSAGIVDVTCSFNDQNLLENFIGFENSIPAISSTRLPSSSSTETDLLQASETSCPVSELKESHFSSGNAPSLGQTCFFLGRSIGLLKQQASSSTLNSCGGCMISSLDNSTMSNNLPLSRIESIIADNEQSVQIISDTITCQCSQDIYLMVVMSIVILKILNSYAAALRPETSFDQSDFSWVADQTANNNAQFASEKLQAPHNVLCADNSDVGEDQGCTASQQILSKLHRIQRLINILSERFKTHRENVKKTQEDPTALVTLTESNMSVFLFPSSTLEHIEAEMRLQLRTLSTDATSILCQA